MAKELLPDALWARIAPLLPPESPKPKGGPGGADGNPVRAEDGHPLGVLACRDGVWERDDVLAQADRIDWDRAALDSAAVPAPGGGQETGKNPTDRGKQGTKRHLVAWLRPHLPAFPRLTTSNSRERSAWTAAHGLCFTRDMTITPSHNLPGTNVS